MRKFERERVEKANDERQQSENSFVLRHLIQMLAYVDFSDVHGKKVLAKLCHDIFANKNYLFLFEPTMHIYKMLEPHIQQRINSIVELISDLQNPTSTQLQQQQQTQQEQQQPMQLESNAPFGDCIDESMTDAAAATGIQPLEPQTSAAVRFNKREAELRISELKFKRLNLKDEFDTLYKEMKNMDKSVDVNKVSEVRVQIKECEDEIARLHALVLNDGQQPTPPTLVSAPSSRVSQATATSSATSSNSGGACETVSTNQEEQEQQAAAAFDPVECAHHCLQLSLCLLQDVELRTLTPQLRSLCDTLVLANVSSVDEELRALAIRALGLICILKLDVAQKYVPLLLEVVQRDKREVMLEAFKALTNCILAFSIAKLVATTTTTSADLPAAAALGGGGGGEEEEALRLEATGKILAVMTSLLDHDERDVYTCAVEAFCKLFMTGHILSAKLFSKLLIMYYSPLTANDVRLRACLATFLPLFAFYRGVNQLCVEESFMITLKCLMNAPTDNYLCEIDLMRVIDILFHLTNPKNLLQRQKNAAASKGICIHSDHII